MHTLGEFRQKVVECIKDAERNFGIDMSMVEIHLNLKGRTAGQALVRRLKATGNKIRYQLYFNDEAIRIGWDDMVKCTIPHEVAHMVEHVAKRHGWDPNSHAAQLNINPLHASGHNEMFRRVATFLGDRSGGERCHSLKLSKSKKVSRHVYVLANNETITMSAVIHNRIQRGTRGYRSARTGYPILAENYKGPKE